MPRSKKMKVIKPNENIVNSIYIKKLENAIESILKYSPGIDFDEIKKLRKTNLEKTNLFIDYFDQENKNKLESDLEYQHNKRTTKLISCLWFKDMDDFCSNTLIYRTIRKLILQLSKALQFTQFIEPSQIVKEYTDESVRIPISTYIPPSHTKPVYKAEDLTESDKETLVDLNEALNKSLKKHNQLQSITTTTVTIDHIPAATSRISFATFNLFTRAVDIPLNISFSYLSFRDLAALILKLVFKMVNLVDRHIFESLLSVTLEAKSFDLDFHNYKDTDGETYQNLLNHKLIFTSDDRLHIHKIDERIKYRESTNYVVFSKNPSAGANESFYFDGLINLLIMNAGTMSMKPLYRMPNLFIVHPSIASLIKQSNLFNLRSKNKNKEKDNCFSDYIGTIMDIDIVSSKLIPERLGILLQTPLIYYSASLFTQVKCLSEYYQENNESIFDLTKKKPIGQHLALHIKDSVSIPLDKEKQQEITKLPD